MAALIGITTGDEDGIGLEVAAKALDHIGPQRSSRFVVWTGANPEPKQVKRLTRKFKILKTSTLSEALSVKSPNAQTLLLVQGEGLPPHWVETAGKACLQHKIAAMATAPLSKQAIVSSGLKDIGHTDILKRLSNKSEAFMGFIGRHFNVVLITGHIPLNAVTTQLTSDKINHAIEAAKGLQSLLPANQRRRPMALLGVNPHAGDQGIIGREEIDLLVSVLKNHSGRQRIEGPLVPDAAFHRSNWSKYSCFLACYHDQGLIPFKAVHGHDSGVHLTLGLSLKRTSVDHGTAKDIFGKNLANPKSMIEAIKLAQVWAHKKK